MSRSNKDSNADSSAETSRGRSRRAKGKRGRDGDDDGENDSGPAKRHRGDKEWQSTVETYLARYKKKADVVSLAESHGQNADGTKRQIIERLMAAGILETAVPDGESPATADLGGLASALEALGGGANSAAGASGTQANTQAGGSRGEVKQEQPDGEVFGRGVPVSRLSGFDFTR